MLTLLLTDEYEEEVEMDIDDQGEIRPPSSSYYMMQNGGHRQQMQAVNRTVHLVQNSGEGDNNRTAVSQGYKFDQSGNIHQSKFLHLKFTLNISLN
jgi:hypothetical protein